MHISKKQLIGLIFICSFLGAALAFILQYSLISVSNTEGSNFSITKSQRVSSFKNQKDTSFIVPNGMNFLTASDRVVPGVVHIQSTYGVIGGFSNFDHSSQSTGSGVILTANGYIVTNHHVIENASTIEVVLHDNRSFKAKLIGFDETTDLALIKITANNLPFVVYGDSDNVRPGEWVLAIGNPFNLNSTVTAGIVSAKGRNINVLSRKSRLHIESFIQTDAAVNPGNSGGALVNLKGELIGINTAIATESGSYEGYSFAVPVTLVQKVMDDLLEFGKVQRGLLGISIDNMNAEIADILNTDYLTGVFVLHVAPNSAADEAGLLKGDIIVEIQGKPIKNVAELQELVARNRPGDLIEVGYIRAGISHNTKATLKDVDGNAHVSYREFDNNFHGAVLKDLTEEELERYDLENGVKFYQIQDGKWKDAGIEEGFIIIQIDKIPVLNFNELIIMMEYKKGGILIEGIQPNGEEKLMAIDW